MKKKILQLSILLILAIVFGSCNKVGKVTPDIAAGGNIVLPNNFHFPVVTTYDPILVPPHRKTTSSGRYEIEIPQAGFQGTSNSCNGWAVAYGMMSCEFKVMHSSSSYSTDDLFSPLYIWNQLNGGKDIPTDLEGSMHLVMDQGCCKWSFMPANIISPTVQPTIDARNNASNYKFSNVIQLGIVDENLIKPYIDDNHPLAVGVWIDDVFRHHTKMDPSIFTRLNDGRYIWYSVSKTNRVGHTILICGYDDNIHAFKALNSFGPGWGNDGSFWISYDFFKSIVITDYNGLPEIYIGVPEKLSSSLHIGDAYQGGIIAYLLSPGDDGYDPSVQHGLIAAPNDQSPSTPWYNGTFTTTGATGIAIGTGKANTDAIIASQGSGNYAAWICRSLNIGGYSDWYLPSNDELTQLGYHSASINFSASSNYWSSTEVDDQHALIWGYSSGYGYYKGFTCRVRAIRRF